MRDLSISISDYCDEMSVTTATTTTVAPSGVCTGRVVAGVDTVAVEAIVVLLLCLLAVMFVAVTILPGGVTLLYCPFFRSREHRNGLCALRTL